MFSCVASWPPRVDSHPDYNGCCVACAVEESTSIKVLDKMQRLPGRASLFFEELRIKHALKALRCIVTLSCYLLPEGEGDGLHTPARYVWHRRGARIADGSLLV